MLHFFKIISKISGFLTQYKPNSKVHVYTHFLSQYLIDRGHSAECTFVFRYDFPHLLELKVVDVAYEGLVLTGDGTVGVHDRAGRIELLADRLDKLVGFFCDDRNLLDRFEVIGEMVNDRSGDKVNEEAQQCSVPVDQEKRAHVHACVESDQDAGHTEVLPGLVRNLLDHDICKDLRPVNTASIPKYQRKSYAQYCSAKSNGEEVFGVELKRDLFEEAQSHRINDRADKCFETELHAKHKNRKDQKREKYEEHTRRKRKAGSLAYDDRHTRSSIIDRIIRKQNTSNRKRRQQRPRNDRNI